MPATAITDADFQSTVLDADRLTLVDCWAVWCGPCKKLSPIVDQMADEYEGKLVVTKLDVGTNQKTAVQYGIQNLPTILFFKGGEVVDRLHGMQSPAALRKRIDALL